MLEEEFDSGRTIEEEKDAALIDVSQRFSNNGACPSRGRDAMIEGMRMTPGNRYTCTIFVDISLIYSEWGARIFFRFQRGALQNIIEKY